GAGSAAQAPSDFARAVADDLKSHRGRSLVVAGDDQPAAVHALAHAINAALANTGQTVVATDPVPVRPESQIDSLKQLVADMEHGQVETLIILGGNPVFTSPADVAFARALDKVGLRVHLGSHQDETSALCHWQVPEAHFLESWSDARAFDGTASIVQPLIAPLYNGKSAHEVLAALSDRPEKSAYSLGREFWKVDKDDKTWRRGLHGG